MFWENREWRAVEPDQLGAVVTLLRSGLESWEEESVVLGDEVDVERTKDSLVVQSARVRPLPFYPDHWLYELKVSVREAGLEDRYEWALAFAIASPTGAAGRSRIGESEVPLHQRQGVPQAGISVVFLDWTSGTIHALNVTAQMRLEHEGTFDRELSIEYLDFFTSFLVGDTDSPFLIVREGDLGHPGGVKRWVDLPSFETSIGERVLKKSYRRPSRYQNYPDDASAADSNDLPQESVADPAAPPSQPSGAAAPAEMKSSASTSADLQGEGEGQVIRDIAIESEDSASRSLTLTALVVYEAAYFKTTFQISSAKDFETAVAMIQDDPIQSADGRLAAHRIVRVGTNPIRLLAHPRSRTEVNSAEFLHDVAAPQDGDAGFPSCRAENRRVRGDVDFRQISVKGPLHIRDVEFLGRVLLEECRMPASVTFEQCKFASSLDAKNLSIEGDLVLKRSIVYGATPDGEDPVVSICLDGARLSGTLQAQQLTVDGYISANNIVIKGKASFQGVDIRARSGAENFGLCLRNSRVDAGLDLTPFEESKPRNRFVRTRIEETVDLQGLTTSAVDVRGAICSSVDLSYSNIAGLLNLDCHYADPAARGAVPGAIDAKFFRTRIVWNVTIRGAQIGEVFLRGAHIGGELSFLFARIKGTIFARPMEYSGYRTVVNGAVILSGASIGGDADFRGAKIAGAFEARTGSIGRLALSLWPVALRAQTTIQLDYFPAELGWLEVIGVTDLKGVGLGGIVIAGRRDGMSAVLFEHVHVNGDVRFYWGPRDEMEFSSARRCATDLAAGDSEPKDKVAVGGQDVVVMRREASLRTCGSVVNGSVEMRKIVTAGQLDLTNLNVTGGGRIRLNDAHIGTDLRARGSHLRGKEYREQRDGGGHKEDAGAGTLSLRCAGFELNNSHIDGDALLSGIDLDGEHEGDGYFSGKGLCVGGDLELFAGGPYFAKIKGFLDLNGAKASQLSLHGHSFPQHPNRNRSADRKMRSIEDPKPTAKLARCEFGKLRLEEPIPVLDMTGIKVANWEIHDVSRHIEILERMYPMDRSVWIDVETDLRNQTREVDADRIYVAMKDAEPIKARWAALKWGLRALFKYGTDMRPAFLATILSTLILFAVFSQPQNVKASDGLLMQLSSQCRDLGGPQKVVLPKCIIYYANITGPHEPSMEISAESLTHHYGLAESLRLTMRYAVPLLGAIGDPDWVPTEESPAIVAWGMKLPVSASNLGLVVLIVNTVLLFFATTFLTKRLQRWLR